MEIGLRGTLRRALVERVLQFTAAKPFFIMESATKTQAKNKYQVSIDLLNDAVGKEIATSLQYMYFHTHFEDDRYQYLSKIMREISIAERLCRSIIAHCVTARPNSRPAASVSVKFRVESTRP